MLYCLKREYEGISYEVEDGFCNLFLRPQDVNALLKHLHLLCLSQLHHRSNTPEKYSTLSRLAKFGYELTNSSRLMSLDNEDFKILTSMEYCDNNGFIFEIFREVQDKLCQMSIDPVTLDKSAKWVAQVMSN